MKTAQSTIHETEFQFLLRQAAAEAVAATAAHCRTRRFKMSRHPNGTDSLNEALAWIAARNTQRGWDLLPDGALDAQAPISWAVMELVEWAEHLVRYEMLGDGECRVPLTWLPCGDHALGSRDLTAAVEERLDLLRHELADYGVLMIAPRDAELAA